MSGDPPLAASIAHSTHGVSAGEYSGTNGLQPEVAARDMSSLLKDVYQVHLRLVNELEQVKKKCMKLERTKQLIVKKSQELQAFNNQLQEEQGQLHDEVNSLQARLLVPCNECQSYRQQIKLQKNLYDQLYAIVSASTLTRVTPTVVKPGITEVQHSSADENHLATGTVSEVLSTIVKLQAALTSDFSPSDASKHSKTRERNSGSPVVAIPCSAQELNASSRNSAKVTSADSCGQSSEKLPTAEGTRKLVVSSQPAAEPPHGLDAGSSSEEKQKLFKLARVDRKTKCRYKEVPVAEVSQHVCDNEDLKQSDTKQSNTKQYDTKQSNSKLTEMAAAYTQYSDHSCPASKPKHRPSLVVPETVPVDFVLLSDDSQSKDDDNVPQCDTAAVALDLSELAMKAPTSPAVLKSPRSHKQAVRLSRSAVKKNKSPATLKVIESPVHTYSGLRVTSADVTSSPSLFEEDDERRAVWRRPSESPSLLRPLLAAGDAGKGQAVNDDMSDQVLRCNRIVNVLDQSLLQSSPSVLSSRRDQLAAADKNTMAVVVNPATAAATADDDDDDVSSLVVKQQSSVKSCSTCTKENCANCAKSTVIGTLNLVSPLSTSNRCKRQKFDPDETFCPLQPSACLNLSVGADVTCESLPLPGAELNGSLAAGIHLSQYTMNSAADLSQSPDDLCLSPELYFQCPLPPAAGRSSKKPLLSDGCNVESVDVSKCTDKNIDDTGLRSELMDDVESAADRINDSFDRVPHAAAINYKFIEVVRKQNLRRQMDGFACEQCQQWFAGMNLSKEELCERMKHCRHKARCEPASTPDHYWSVSFPTTQQCLQQGNAQETSVKQSRCRRKKGLRKLFDTGQQISDSNDVTK